MYKAFYKPLTISFLLITGFLLCLSDSEQANFIGYLFAGIGIVIFFIPNHLIMQQLIKADTLSDLNKFFAGRQILIIKGEKETVNTMWVNEVCTFIEMVGKAEKIKDQLPTDIKMKVKTGFGMELLLEQDEVFIIVKSVYQRPKFN